MGSSSDITRLRNEADNLKPLILQSAVALEEHSGNVKIAGRVGAGVAIGGATLVGIALLPFTAGLSALIPAIVGASVAGAGAVTAAGGAIADHELEKKVLRERDVKWTTFQGSLKKYVRYKGVHASHASVQRLLDDMGSTFIEFVKVKKAGKKPASVFLRELAQDLETLINILEDE